MSIINDILGGNRTQNKFSKTYTKEDFNVEDLAPSSTDWRELGEHEVTAQQTVRYGYGNAEHPDNQGFLYIKLEDDGGNELEGKIRLAQINALETKKIVVYEERTEVLKGSLNDKSKKIAFPEQAQFPRVGESSMLILEVKMDETTEISASDSTMLVPVSVYY